MDHLSEEKRSWNMSRIKSKDTSPELYVRSTLHQAGFRFRLHVKEMPGKPDIVLPKYKTVIFVHGCFWHRHPGCSRATMPSSNTDYWKTKFERNVERDKKEREKLHSEGWKVIIIWECEVKEKTKEIIFFLKKLHPHK
jgi:DNA mismatch endonuclease (patch repair protein)